MGKESESASNEDARTFRVLAPITRSEVPTPVVVVWALSIVVFTAASLIQLDSWVEILPGQATSVEKKLKVSGAKQYRSDGQIMWATVGLREKNTVVQLIDGWLRTSVDVKKREEVLGDDTPEEARRVSKAAMADAKTIAKVVAARRVGLGTSGGGALVVDVDPKVPAAKVLKNDDLIVGVNGAAVCLPEDLRLGLAETKVGDEVSLTVKSGGPNGKTSEVKTVTVANPRTKRPMIGIITSVTDDSPCNVDATIDVDTAKIGGPSAGLAMTLGIIDSLSAGSLTGGKKVAVTGTISGDENVGEVGGVKQKTVTVKDAGADLFIVPVNEVEIAKKWAGKMKIVGVRTLDDALNALLESGGDPLPVNTGGGK